MPLPLDGVFTNIERIYMPRWHSWINCLRSLPSSTPLQVAYFHNRTLKKRAEELMPAHDAVFAHLIRAGDMIQNSNIPKFLEMTDAISLNYTRIRSTTSSLRDFRTIVFSIEAMRLRQYERKIVQKFDHCFLVSEVDKRFLFPTQGADIDNVSICSCGVDFDKLQFNFSQTGQDIVFIGNMYSLQNLDAAKYMANDILPLVRSRLKGTKLRLIGRITRERRRSISQNRWRGSLRRSAECGCCS